MLGSLVPKVETWRDIFFASLLSAMDIVFLFYFGNISKQTSLKALQSVFLVCLSDSLREIAFSVSIGKSKSMIG